MSSGWNGFVGTAKRLEDIDIPRIGAEIDVGEDELHAFMDAETNGDGFDRFGRPKMLFEPHIFWRLLPADQRPRARKFGIAYPKWGEKPYPRDSYLRLENAMEINWSAALQSASWGLGQILGTNYRAVGYQTVESMVVHFMDDEEKHLEAIVRFLVANSIDDDLRRLAEIRKSSRPTQPSDCAPIARVYNGPGYAAHGYHIRMAAAHNKWRGIPDTPFDPATDAR